MTASCRGAATRALSGYDVGSIEAWSQAFGAVRAERFAAHTRCRNATPRGHVICLERDATRYLVIATWPGCRGNAFAEDDPAGSIAAGMSFSR